MSLNQYATILKGRFGIIVESPPTGDDSDDETDSTGSATHDKATTQHPPKPTLTATEPKTMILNYVDITQWEASYGDRPLITVTAGFRQAKEEDEKFSEYAIVLRRRVNKLRESIDVTIEIQSDIIRKGIQEAFGEYFSVNLLASPIVFQQPYYPLVHFRKELEEYACSPIRTAEEKEHMKVLSNFIQVNLAKTLRQYDRMVSNGFISFEFLRFLFRPGQLVLSLNDELKECFYLLHAYDNQHNGEEWLELICLCWKYDGKSFGPCSEILKIPMYSGFRKILQLEFVPLALLPAREQAKQRASLITRGKLWRSMVNVSHHEYNGTVWTPEEDLVGPILKHANGRVVLDHETYFQQNPRKRISLVRTGQLIDIDRYVEKDVDDDESAEDLSLDTLGLDDDPEERVKLRKDPILQDISKSYLNKNAYELSDIQALLCPCRVPGFALAEKTWGLFLVDNVQQIKWSNGSFDNLEFDLDKKKMVQTLVKIHQKSHSTFDDIIIGKGKGLVFCLHGPPGGGKTLTAEMVAEYTRRPLYCVTSGDLGTDPQRADHQLRNIFSIAKAWNAIVLLDEADVFLSKRKSDDIDRNAFVTIFLRCLEWFQGILFLTSNRPEEFDEAFRSRFTCLYTIRRWMSTGELMSGDLCSEEQECLRQWDFETFRGLGRRYELNGREIKNLISTSEAVCIEQNCFLNEKTIELVYLMNHSGGNPVATVTVH